MCGGGGAAENETQARQELYHWALPHPLPEQRSLFSVLPPALLTKPPLKSFKATIGVESQSLSYYVWWEENTQAAFGQAETSSCRLAPSISFILHGFLENIKILYSVSE